MYVDITLICILELDTVEKEVAADKIRTMLLICRLTYNVENHTTRNTPGVEIRVPYFGETTGIEWLNDVHFG